MPVLPKLYVQCNPLLDISAVVDEAFLQRYNVERASASLLAESQQGIYADLERQPGVVYVPGGSGLNTARVAQWISRAAQGDFVTFVGCIADDKYGKILKDAAEADGVHMELEYTTKAPTGSCAVCIYEKERSLIANLAAANCLSAAHMQSPGVLHALAAARLFYLTGFTLTVQIDFVLQVAHASRAVQGKFMLNLSAPFIVQLFTESLKQVLPYVDVIFANETEAKALASVYEWPQHDVEQIAVRAATELPYENTHDRLVVFTQGSEPTVYATRSGRHGHVAVPALPASKIVDTNGGGDAFVGGFLAAYALGRDVVRCCEVGNYAGGVILQHNGCTYPPQPEMSP